MPTVNLFISYQFDNGFFAAGSAARTAIESVASELGSRLVDTLNPLATTTATVSNPSQFAPGSPGNGIFAFADATGTLSAAANTLTIFVGSTNIPGSTVGIGGYRWNTGIRDFEAGTSVATYDFQPYVGYISFDNTATWNFAGTGGSGTDFRSVARHEMLHVLGIGGDLGWDALTTGGQFTGPKTRAANGNVNPTVTGDEGHFAQTENSIMRPVISDIKFPTAIDWAALDDIGWEVTSAPASGTYADVFGRTSAGTWLASQNLGTGLSTPLPIGQWAEGANWRDVATGDFNNDDRTDVIGRTSGGDWYVGLNTGGAFSNRFFGHWAAESGDSQNPTWRDVLYGDFNTDGRTDVAGRASSGEWYVGLSNGTSFATTLWAGWNPGAGWQDVRVGDFTSDGRDDVAGRASNGEWYVARSTGTGFATARWAGWSPTAGWVDVLVADFTGDGRADIAGRTSGGEWYVARSTGTAFVTARWAGWSGTVAWRDVRAGDFGGDGRIDILGRTPTGQFYVGVNTGGMSFATAAFGQWTERSWATVLIGDFGGNAKLDVLARATDGTWQLALNGGTTFTARAYGQWNAGLGWRSVAASKRVFTSGAGATPVALRAAETISGQSADPAFTGAAASVRPASGVPTVGFAPWSAEEDRPVFAADEEREEPAAVQGLRDMSGPPASIDDLVWAEELLDALMSVG